MNFVPSLINRSLMINNPNLTIVLTDTDQKEFILFLEMLGHKLIEYDDLYYGGELPDMVLCNNKIVHYNLCRKLSLTYHIPSIVVDHSVKNDIYNNDKIKFLDNLPSSFKIATNTEIYRSWHNIHDKVLPYGNNKDYITNWSSFLLEISQKGFDL
jgi:hypothetical protein